MVFYSENPFRAASSLNVVTDTDFIGRKDDVQRLGDLFVHPPANIQRGCLEIIGLPDIGKRCLVNKALLSRKEELYQKKLIPIEIDINNYKNVDGHEQFFRDLMLSCIYELKDGEFEKIIVDIPPLIKKLNDVLQEWDEGNKAFLLLQRFFKNLLRVGVRIMFILDNFDYIVPLFKEHIDHIKWLRSLAGTRCQVIWVTLSCNPLREMHEEIKYLSNEHFQEHRLRMFTQEDMQHCVDILSQKHVVLTEEHKQKIMYYCGYHPYLLTLLGYHLIEDHIHDNKNIDIERTFKAIEDRFKQSYDRIIKFVLGHDEGEEKIRLLLKMTSHPDTTIEQKDINRMLALDLIHANTGEIQEQGQVTYAAFSPHFQEYLFSLWSDNEPPRVENGEDIFEFTVPPLWNQTMAPGTTWKNYQIVGYPETTWHSQVVKAYDTRLHRYVAIKSLYVRTAGMDYKSKKSWNESFMREARILSNIRHENIGLLYSFEEDLSAIVMEWIEGKPLDQMWDDDFTAIKAVNLGIKLARALTYLHTKDDIVIHRDIKPGNIIIRDNGEPVLIDFDISRSGREETITPYDQESAYKPIGTHGYYAPEQETDPKNITYKVDIYALGVVLYEALTGKKQPFVPHARIPDPLWPIIVSMLAVDPNSRPDAKQLEVKLEHCLKLMLFEHD